MLRLITTTDLDGVPKLVRVGAGGAGGIVAAEDPGRCRCCGPGGGPGPCRGCCTESQRPGCTSREITGLYLTSTRRFDFPTFEEWKQCCYKRECTRTRASRTFRGGLRPCLRTGRFEVERVWTSEDESNGPGGLRLRTVVTTVHDNCSPFATTATEVVNPNPGSGLCGLPTPWRIPTQPAEVISEEGIAAQSCTRFSAYLARVRREFYPIQGVFQIVDEVWNDQTTIGTDAAACQGCEQPPGSLPQCFPAVDQCCDVATSSCFQAPRPSIGGVVQGPGSGCARYGGVPIADCRGCGPAGACCFAGYCMRLRGDACARIGGDFGGAGSVCRSGLCAAPDEGGSDAVTEGRSDAEARREGAKLAAHVALWDETLELGAGAVRKAGLIVPRREIVRVSDAGGVGAGGIESGAIRGGGCSGCSGRDVERW